MDMDELVFEDILDESVGQNVFLEDLIDDPATSILEQAMKDTMVDMWASTSKDYELLDSPGPCVKLEEMSPTTNYLDWINLDDKVNGQYETAVPPSNSSDSGLSSDFHYDQQLSPSMNDRCSPRPAGGSTCSSVDVDNISSPDSETDTLCPSSPCSDIHMVDDPDITTQPAPTKNLPAKKNLTSGSLVIPLSLKGLNNLGEIKAVKIIRNGSALVSEATSAVLGGIKSTSAHVPDAIKKLLGPSVHLSVTTTSPQQPQTGSTSSSTGNKSSYPPIILSDEERRLLSKEGIVLPTHYPLAKHEERELKRIRRKIRNKISAQDSRKRKRVYMDGLEDRVKQCSDENVTLQKRIRLLETENKSLLSQLKRLQSILTGQSAGNSTAAASATTNSAAPSSTATTTTTANNTAQPATCLLVLMLSFALFLLPNLKPGESSKNLANGRASEVAESMMKMPPFAGRSRALLHDALALENDSELSEMELDMAISGEVVLGEEEEEGGLYVPLPVGQLMMNTGGGDPLSKPGAMGQWGQKFGKQYPVANAKRNVPAFLSEHDYYSADPAAKRARLADALSEVDGDNIIVSPPPIIPAAVKELNQSQLYDELAELARGQQNIVHVRISSEEL